MAATPSLDHLCTDVLRIINSCLDPRDLLTFNLTCKATHEASQLRLAATALARCGARVALRRLRTASTARAFLAQNMTCKTTLSDRDQCFAQLKWCLSRSDDPLSDLTTALHKTQNALTQQTDAPHTAVRPILEDVGLWIIFVCLAAWRMHMHKATGVQSQAEVVQHDLWGILDNDAAGAIANNDQDAAGAGAAAAAALQADDAVPEPHAQQQEQQEGQEQQQEGQQQQQQQQQQQGQEPGPLPQLAEQQQEPGEEQAAVAVAEPAAPTTAGLFADLLANLRRMVYSPNPSKKPGLATLNIIIHFLAETTAEA